MAINGWVFREKYWEIRRRRSLWNIGPGVDRDVARKMLVVGALLPNTDALNRYPLQAPALGYPEFFFEISCAKSLFFVTGSVLLNAVKNTW